MNLNLILGTIGAGTGIKHPSRNGIGPMIDLEGQSIDEIAGFLIKMN